MNTEIFYGQGDRIMKGLGCIMIIWSCRLDFWSENLKNANVHTESDWNRNWH